MNSVSDKQQEKGSSFLALLLLLLLLFVVFGGGATLQWYKEYCPEKCASAVARVRNELEKEFPYWRYKQLHEQNESLAELRKWWKCKQRGCNMYDHLVVVRREYRKYVPHEVAAFTNLFEELIQARQEQAKIDLGRWLTNEKLAASAKPVESDLRAVFAELPRGEQLRSMEKIVYGLAEPTP